MAQSRKWRRRGFSKTVLGRFAGGTSAMRFFLGSQTADLGMFVRARASCLSVTSVYGSRKSARRVVRDPVMMSWKVFETPCEREDVLQRKMEHNVLDKLRHLPHAVSFGHR